MLHSVTLDEERCKGCTTCIKMCPTEAIRVRRGRAEILPERCIDCGQCIRVCPHHAKKAVCDPFERVFDFEYRVALPAPAFYGQFHNLDDVNIVLQALLDIGFHQIYEVSRAAEMISDLTRAEMKRADAPKPWISSACPATVRLVTQRFPKLIANLVPTMAPVELAAVRARAEAMAETGLPGDKIGVFFITPCPAKVTAVRHPLGLDRPVLDGAIAMSEVYLRLLPAMKKVQDPPMLSKSGIIGIGWATAGGESAALLKDRYLAVDGIENVIQVLEDIEDEKHLDAEFVEINACTQGCVGGCLTLENPFAAKMRVKKLMRFLPVSRNTLDPEDKKLVFWDTDLRVDPVQQLDPDRATALRKMQSIKQLISALPGLDCGSCGAPSCRALAEDVVQGRASEEDCIFRMQERMQYLSGTGDAEIYLPPPFRKHIPDSEK